MIFEIFTWALMLGSAMGAWRIAQKRKSGFYWWIVTNMGWVIVDSYQGLYAQAALFGLYTWICIHGIRTWSKDEA